MVICPLCHHESRNYPEAFEHEKREHQGEHRVAVLWWTVPCRVTARSGSLISCLPRSVGYLKASAENTTVACVHGCSNETQLLR